MERDTFGRGFDITSHPKEGAERATPSDFARFLDIAKGSTGEVRSLYRLAARLGFASPDLVETRCAQCTAISRQLAGFAKYLRSKKK